MRSDIYTGMKYYHYTILSRDDKSGGNGKHFRWNLLCDCGNIINVSSHTIQQKNKPRCICFRNIKDLTGTIFGNIMITGFAGYDLRYNRKRLKWFYQCLKCSIIKSEVADVINRGDITSCGTKGCRLSGPDSPKYKPDSIHRQTRRDGKRKIWSYEVFQRDNFKCVCCGNNKNIEAHHLNGWNWCEAGRFDINNGVTLCKNKLSGCHYFFHKKYGHGNNTKEQFEEFLLNYERNNEDN